MNKKSIHGAGDMAQQLKSTECSSRGSRFNSLHPRGSLQSPVTAVPRDMMTFWSPEALHAYGPQRYGDKNTHTHTIKIKANIKIIKRELI